MEEPIAFESLKCLYRKYFVKAFQNNLAKGISRYRTAHEQNQVCQNNNNQDEGARILFEVIGAQMAELSEFSVTTPNVELRNEAETIWKLVQDYKGRYAGKISPNHIDFVDYMQRGLEEVILTS